MSDLKIPDNARELVPAESLKLIESVEAYCGSIVSVQVQSVQEYDNAVLITKQLHDFGTGLENERKRLKKPYDDKGKAIQDAFLPFLNVVDGAKRKIKQAIWEYQNEQEKKRRAEQERLNREAEEKRRAAEEAARKEREKAEALRAQGRDDLADKAEARADAKENKAQEITPAVAQAPIPLNAPRGVAGRTNWRGIIDDPVVFKKHCINEMLHDFLMVDEKAWNQYAKIRKEVVTVPGARIVKETV
jgi:septal ring factor EnvC (AmiA/AmiB activator)